MNFFEIKRLSSYLSGDAQDSDIGTPSNYGKVTLPGVAPLTDTKDGDDHKHSNGTPCKASSPDTCPFNRKVENGEKEISGKESIPEFDYDKFKAIMKKPHERRSMEEKKYMFKHGPKASEIDMARTLGFLGDDEDAGKWLEKGAGKEYLQQYADIADITGGDKDKTKDLYQRYRRLFEMFNFRGAEEKRDALFEEFGDSKEARRLKTKLNNHWKMIEKFMLEN